MSKDETTPSPYQMFTQIAGRPETRMPLGPVSEEDTFTTDELVEIHHLPRHRVLHMVMCHTCAEVTAFLIPDPGPLHDLTKGGRSYEDLSEEEKQKHNAWRGSAYCPLFADDGSEYQDPNDERTGGLVMFDESRENPVEVELKGAEPCIDDEDTGEEGFFTLDPTDAVLMAEKLLEFFAPYKLADGMTEITHEHEEPHKAPHKGSSRAVSQRFSSTKH